MYDVNVPSGNNILCVNDMVDLIKQSKSKINVYLVIEDQINTINSLNIAKKSPTFQGSSRVQQFTWTNADKDTLCLRYLSCSVCKSDCNHYQVSKVRVNVQLYSEDKTPDLANVPYS